MEILDGVHRIDAEVGGRPLYLFLFLGERNLLLDAGCSTTVAETLLPYLGTLELGPRDLDLLVITHCDLDHQGGAHALDALAPSELHGCHWPGCSGEEVAAFLDESRAYVEHIDGLVRACLGEAPEGLTLRELIDRVNERLDTPWEPDLAQELVYSVHGHAERQAVRAGRNADGHVVYRAREGT